MRLNRTFGSVFAAVTLSALVACSPSGKEAADIQDLGAAAADATGVGPAEVTSSEYKLPAGVDADVLAGRATEVWARVYRPKQMAEGEKHPVLVFLHGNHGTCGRGTNPRRDDNVQYTTSGTCPTGYVVTPNHEGYAYIAERLASWGYVVVSINANRGITAGAGVAGDGGLNLARGRLILKHLSLLSQWNKEAGTTPESLGFDLAGKLDFSNVGMMGHSRGGEGIRAAYEQYRDEGSPWPARIDAALKIKAMFEIGPVDGQTGRVLNADGTAWNVILPMCDGDVSNLQGMKPFDRMLPMTSEASAQPKGMFAVWGANHNYFNTEWQESDSSGCRGTNHQPLFQSGVSGSEKQRATGLHALMGFFRAHVGANAELAFNNAYDPQYALPPALDQVTHIGRAYSDASSASQVLIVEDFTKPAGTSLGGQDIVSSNVTVANSTPPEHDTALKAALVKWTEAGENTSLTIPWAATGDGADASTMKTLDFRTGVQNSTVASLGTQNFHVQLVNADDSLSEKVSLSDYLTLTAGGHVILETVRIPLGDFKNANLAKVRGVKLSFDDTSNGSIYVAAVRFSRAAASAAPVNPGTPGNDATPPGAADEVVPVTTGNAVNALRVRPSTDVDVELASTTPFPVLDELARLRVNGKDVVLSRYSDEGDIHKIVFTMTAADFAAAPDGAQIKVRYGADKATHEWDFGTLNKSAATN